MKNKTAQVFFIIFLFVTATFFGCSANEPALGQVLENDIMQSFEAGSGENEAEQAAQGGENSTALDNEQDGGMGGASTQAEAESEEQAGQGSGQSTGITVNSDVISLMNYNNGEIKNLYGTEAGAAIYWGGTPMVGYMLQNGEGYLSVLLDGGDSDIFEPFSAGGGVDATQNIWPDDYTVYGLVYSGDVVSSVFGSSEALTYDELKNSIDGFPELQHSEANEMFDFSVPYCTYIVGDYKLELEFDEVNGEYELAIVMIVDKNESIDTLTLRV